MNLININNKKYLMQNLLIALTAILSSILIVCPMPASVKAAGELIVNVLPAPSCTNGWAMENKALLFNKENLYERINGESELYFPYGFEALAAARYVKNNDPNIAMEVDVYRMGSSLNAFGIYSSYRRKDDTRVNIGTDGFISQPQVLFYQERYFVRVQATGTQDLDQNLLLACAGAISKNLPVAQGRPRELDAFMIPQVVRNSERYIAQSLLGYEFFRKGITAEAVLDGEKLQVFVITEDSLENAGKVFMQYALFLKESGKAVKITGVGGNKSLESVDPLYGIVYLSQSGPNLTGAVRSGSILPAQKIVELLEKHLHLK